MHLYSCYNTAIITSLVTAFSLFRCLMVMSAVSHTSGGIISHSCHIISSHHRRFQAHTMSWEYYLVTRSPYGKIGLVVRAFVRMTSSFFKRLFRRCFCVWLWLKFSLVIYSTNATVQIPYIWMLSRKSSRPSWCSMTIFWSCVFKIWLNHSLRH